MPLTRCQKRLRGDVPLPEEETTDSSEEEELTVTRYLGMEEELTFTKQNDVLTQTNPLYDNTVLTRLFEVCSLSDLPQFRLVSKRWYFVSLPIFRSNMTFRINQFKTHMTRIGEEVNTMDKVEEQVAQLDVDRHPFTSYFFNGFPFYKHSATKKHSKLYRFREGHTTTNKMFIQQNKIWDKIGPSMKKLELSTEKIICLDSLRRAIFEQAPNLESLSLDLVYEERSYEPKPPASDKVVNVQPHLKTLEVQLHWDFPLCWKEILATFPNLETIDLGNFDSAKLFLPFVEAFEDVSRRKTKIVKIRKFALDCCFDEGKVCCSAAARLLHLPEFQLESLNIRRIPPGNAETRFITSALQTHGNTLKKLGISKDNKGGKNGFINFPFQRTSFELMTRLSLEGVVATNFHFLEQFPNLKELRIRQFKAERMLANTEPLRMAKMSLPRLHTFAFRVFATNEHNLSAESVEMFAKLMPNVVEFSANLLPPGLRAVCRNWPKMRKLRIFVYKGGQPEWKRESLSNIATLSDSQQLTEGNTDNPAMVWSCFEEMSQLKSLDAIQFSPGSISASSSDESDDDEDEEEEASSDE